MAGMAFDLRMTGDDPTDQLIRAARGEAGALAALYRAHGDTIYRFAWALTGSESLAADVLQATTSVALHRTIPRRRGSPWRARISPRDMRPSGSNRTC